MKKSDFRDSYLFDKIMIQPLYSRSISELEYAIKYMYVNIKNYSGIQMADFVAMMDHLNYRKNQIITPKTEQEELEYDAMLQDMIDNDFAIHFKAQKEYIELDPEFVKHLKEYAKLQIVALRKKYIETEEDTGGKSKKLKMKVGGKI